MEGELVAAELGMSSIRETNGARGPGDFFHGNAMSLVAHFYSAVLLFYGYSKETSISYLLPHILWEFIAFVDFGCDFLGYLPFCKLSCSLSKLRELFRRQRLEIGSVLYSYQPSRLQYYRGPCP